jgi:Putative peptidoglycan binding domain
MRSISCLRWFLAGALAASLPVAGQAASGHAMGMGFAGGGSQRPMGGSGRAMGHAFGGRFGHGRFFGHDRFDHGRFADHDFFHHHNRFIFVFDFASFGFPWWWGSWWGGYPYPYYGYPYDYGYYDYGPAYDYEYWRGLAVSVQSELARRGYYHGEVDGMIGSRSRAAIKEFQASKGLPGTGMIDAKLLKALGIRYRTA